MTTVRRFAASVATAVICALAPDALRAQALHLEGLRTEYLQNPIGIDVRAPRLSWRIHAERRGMLQSAYQTGQEKKRPIE